MSGERDPRVDAYIDPLPAWQREICQRVRGLSDLFVQIVAHNRAGGWRRIRAAADG